MPLDIDDLDFEFEALPVPDDSIDILFSLAVVEHICLSLVLIDGHLGFCVEWQLEYFVSVLSRCLLINVSYSSRRE